MNISLTAIYLTTILSVVINLSFDGCSRSARL